MNTQNVGWLDILTYAAIFKVTSSQISSNGSFQFTSLTNTSIDEIMLSLFLVSNYSAIIVLAVAS